MPPRSSAAKKVSRRKPAPPRYSAPALDKGLDILELLADQEHGLTLNEIAQHLGRTVSEIFRMTVTLQHRGWLNADGSDRYTLSLHMLELAHRLQPLKSLVAAALPLLRELANRAYQSCHLATYHEGQIIVVAQVDSPGALSFGLKVGALGSLTGTASGTLMLAFRDIAERRRMLDAHVIIKGELSIDPVQLEVQLDDAREQGFVTWPSRRAQGATDIARPIFDISGQAIAAISVPYIERLDRPGSPSVAEVAEIVRVIATRLSELMCYRGYDSPSV
jgi:DNA-binding IclR family transcriptional regulator